MEKVVFVIIGIIMNGTWSRQYGIAQIAGKTTRSSANKAFAVISSAVAHTVIHSFCGQIYLVRRKTASNSDWLRSNLQADPTRLGGDIRARTCASSCRNPRPSPRQRAADSKR